MGIRCIIKTTICSVIVIGIQKIVAPASVCIVASGTTDQPVIPQTTEDPVVTIIMDRAKLSCLLSDGFWINPSLMKYTFCFVEVKQESRNLE